MLNKPQGQRVKHKTNMGQALAPTPPVCPSISPQNQLLNQITFTSALERKA